MPLRTDDKRKILTLGELIDVLASFDEDLYAFFENGSVPDVIPISYRGYYDQLALGDTGGSYWMKNRPKNPTVKNLLKGLKDVNNTVVTGYKGGDYDVNLKTNIWYSNYSFASGIKIVGAVQLNLNVVIETANDESRWW